MPRGQRGELLYTGIHTLDLTGRLARFPWGLLFLLLLVASFGLIVLYSAVGGEKHVQMAWKQVFRFGFSMGIMWVVAMVGDKLYRRYAYLVYGIALLLLSAVVVAGSVALGARRWLDLGVINLQPSELMKVAIILMLARYFHDRAITRVLGLRDLWIPVILIVAPLVLILKQPDLGTAVLLAAISMSMLFVAGLSWKAILIMTILGGASLPLLWNVLHDYQKQRIITLFSPEQDPLGAGYHIIQSKIAVGSGGLTGKGFMGGSQSHLDFLPEQHTDFIFSVLAEEWGFFGAMVLIGIYLLIILRCVLIAASARDRFGMLLATGATSLFGIQVVINLGMVIGLLPVVGIPLPLVSYGGSSMLTVMIAMGLLANVEIHSRQRGDSGTSGNA